jgi:hypothetical protein
VPTSTRSSSFFVFCSINVEQSYVLSVSVCSGVLFQPAHCFVSLKNLAAASISSSVLRKTFNLWLMRCLKYPNLYVYCLRLVVFLGSSHVLLVLSRPENDRG